MIAQKAMEISCYMEQKLILQDGRDQFCMWHLFRSLPKLRKLSYGCCDERWSPFLSTICSVPDFQHPSLPRYPPLPPRPFQYSLGSYNGNLYEFTGFLSVICAMADDACQIKEFELRAPLELLRMGFSDARDTCEAFRTLTNLSMKFSFVEPPASPAGQPHTPAMQNIITEVIDILHASHTAAMFGAVHGLQSMTLHLVPFRSEHLEYTEVLYQVPFRNIIGGTHWNSLQEVSLRGFDFTAGDFIDFLTDHLNTLTYMELGQINLSEGEWSHIITLCGRMPSLKTLWLDHVQEYHQVDDYWITYNGLRRSGGHEKDFQWERGMRILE